jgi:hypothetical protein
MTIWFPLFVLFALLLSVSCIDKISDANAAPQNVLFINSGGGDQVNKISLTLQNDFSPTTPLFNFQNNNGSQNINIAIGNHIMSIKYANGKAVVVTINDFIKQFTKEKDEKIADLS